MKRRKLVIAVGREETERKDVNDALRCASSVEKAAAENTEWDARIVFVEPRHNKDNFAAIIEPMLDCAPDCVFNLFEGFSYDTFSECEFAKALEDANIPFTGSSSQALSLCLDKRRTNHALKENGLLVPPGAFVVSADSAESIKVTYPVFIKPCCEDSSVGIDEDSLAENNEELYASIKKKLAVYPTGLLVEEFISGKEYNVGYLNDEHYGILGVSVMDFSGGKEKAAFMNYTAKWDTTSDEYRKLIPEVVDLSRLEQVFLNRINDICTKARERLGCSGYFRIDLREREGELYILDINPNPDINEDSGFMRQAYSRGLTYCQVINIIINNALSARRRENR